MKVFHISNIMNYKRLATKFDLQRASFTTFLKLHNFFEPTILNNFSFHKKMVLGMDRFVAPIQPSFYEAVPRLASLELSEKFARLKKQ